MEQKDKQIVIIGAGISGCATAIELLKRGIKPLLIDKAAFPRDTVGEGLSPAIGPYLERLGILEEVLACPGVTRKTSLQLVSPGGHTAYTRIDLSKAPYRDGLHHFPWGFNVRRKYFDYVFYKKALALGAEIILETKVKSILMEAGKVKGLRIIDKENEVSDIRADLVVDCSGRDSVLAKQLGLRAPLENVFEGQWANFAIRLHFTNCNMKPLVKDKLNYDPATVNIIPWNDCWYWFIPIDLEKGIISIGFVARSKLKRNLDIATDKLKAYRQLIEDHPVLREVVKDATVSDNVVATSRLGHMNTHMAGDGFLCVGDSAFFADPAWGTGVTICLQTAFMTTDIIQKAILENDFSNELLQEYEHSCRKLISAPFNSIRAYNYYYNDSEYVDFIVERLSKNQQEMDMIGAILFDYIGHEQFQAWTFKEFKAFLAKKGRIPILNRVSQFDFEQGKVTEY
jgi:flavin-dependent dehydrogenase